jgi:hypothetical protein
MMRTVAILGLSTAVLFAPTAPFSPAVGGSTPASAVAPAPVDIPAPGPVAELVDADRVLDASADGMSGELTDALATLEAEPVGDALGLYEWDGDRRVLRVHAHGDGAAIEAAVANVLPAGSFEMVMDPYPMSELIAASDALARQHSVNGIQIAHAGPRVDGSGIEVGVVAPGSSLPTSLNRVAEQIESQFDVPYPVTVTEASQAIATDRQFQSEPYWGGAHISSPVPGTAAYSACSSGFAVERPAVPSNEAAMLFADHCGEVGRVWGAGLYSNSPLFGTAQETLANGADIRMLTGPVTYWGVNFVGPFDSSRGVAVRGYSPPVLDHSWCMNGSQSGTVCNNTVTSGPQTLNLIVDGEVVSYSNQYRSVQMDDLPAAGSGDSGGPAFRVVEGELYAAGIISAIENGSDACTGKPATASRRCSAVVWTTGLDAFFDSNPEWRILTYPQ